MFCTACGTNLPADSAFCNKCGKAMGENSQMVQPLQQMQYQPPKTGNPMLFYGVIDTIGGVFFLVLYFYLLGSLGPWRHFVGSDIEQYLFWIVVLGFMDIAAGVCAIIFGGDPSKKGAVIGVYSMTLLATLLCMVFFGFEFAGQFGTWGYVVVGFFILNPIIGISGAATKMK